MPTDWLPWPGKMKARIWSSCCYGDDARLVSAFRTGKPAHPTLDFGRLIRHVRRHPGGGFVSRPGLLHFETTAGGASALGGVSDRPRKRTVRHAALRACVS